MKAWHYAVAGMVIGIAVTHTLDGYMGKEIEHATTIVAEPVSRLPGGGIDGDQMHVESVGRECAEAALVASVNAPSVSMADTESADKSEPNPYELMQQDQPRPDEIAHFNLFPESEIEAEQRRIEQEYPLPSPLADYEPTVQSQSHVDIDSQRFELEQQIASETANLTTLQDEDPSLDY